MPAKFTKSDDGDWKVMGLASTSKRDLQGEVVDQTGLDLTPLDMKKGVFNWDHKKGPENTIGVIDAYQKTKDGLFLEGRLLKNHSRAKAVYEIMSSLNKADTGRMGMSIEGVIKERTGDGGKTIKRAVIHSCALTMNPVNTDTHATLLKSLDAVEFTKDDDFPVSEDPSVAEAQREDTADKPLFSANQVLNIMEKALGVGAGYTQAPANLSGGDAMAQSDMKGKKKKKKAEKSVKDSDLYDDRPSVREGDGSNLIVNKSLKKLDVDLYKSHMFNVLDKLQTLYPEYSRSEIWEAVKDRLERKFPDIQQ